MFQCQICGNVISGAISKNNIESISGIINFDEQLKEDFANAKKYVPNKKIFNA